jgi:chromosome segregation ATPase
MDRMSDLLGKLVREPNQELLQTFTYNIMCAIKNVTAAHSFDPDRAALRAEFDLWQNDRATLVREMEELRESRRKAEADAKSSAAINEERVLDLVEERLSNTTNTLKAWHDDLESKLRRIMDNKLEDVSNKVTARLGKLEAREKEHSERNAKLERHLNSTMDEIKGIQKAQERISERCDTLSSQLSTFEKENTDIQKELISANEAELKKIQLIDERINDLSDKVPKLENDMSAMKTEVNVKTKQLESMQREHNTLKQSGTETAEAVTKVKSTMSEVQASLCRQGSQIEDSRSRAALNEEVLKELREELASAREAESKIQKQIASIEASVRKEALSAVEHRLKASAEAEARVTAEKASVKEDVLSAINAKITALEAAGTKAATGPSSQDAANPPQLLSSTLMTIQTLQKEFNVLKNRVPYFIIEETEKCDRKLRADMDERSATVQRSFDELCASHAALEQRVAVADRKATGLEESVQRAQDDVSQALADATTMKTEIKRLEEHVGSLDQRTQHEVGQLRTTMHDEVRHVREHMNSVTVGLRDLEVRYNNISTEELHRQMVHWLQKSYPDAPGFLAKLKESERIIWEIKRDQGRLTDSLLKRMSKIEDGQGAFERTIRHNVEDVDQRHGRAIQRLSSYCWGPMDERPLPVDHRLQQLEGISKEFLAIKADMRLHMIPTMLHDVLKLQACVRSMDKKCADILDDNWMWEEAE